MTTVSQSEFAAILGKNKSYVTRLKQADRLVLTPDGLVDVEASQARIAATAHPSYAKTSQNAPQGDEGRRVVSTHQDQIERAAMSLQAARAVKENYAARMAKLMFERESGKLVDADEVRMFAADLGATFRCALEILPDRIAAELVPLNDVDAIRAVLVEAIEQILGDLAQKIEKGVTRAN